MHGFNTRYFDALSNLNRAFGAYNTLVKPIPEQFLTDDSSNIEEGTVDFVNPKDYSCFVTTTSGKQIPDVLFVSPWFCGANGAGFYMYPQVHSKVLISKAKFTNKYYILGFVPILSNAKTATADDTQYLNGRKTDLTEGDVVLSTEHGPFFKICNYSRSIHLICDSVCRIQMQTSEHKIFLRSHRLYINTAAGLIQMDTTDEGQTITVAYFRMKLGDQENFVKAIIGSTGVSVGDKLKLNHETGEKTNTEVIFALNICNKASITIDTEGNIVTYCKSIENRVVENVNNIINGKITSSVQGGVSTANKGDLKIEATGGLAINAGGTLSLSGKESLVAVGNSTTLGAKNDMNIVSGSTMTRSSNGNIIDQGTGIQHSSGGAGNIPSLQDVSVNETEITGIVDTSISVIEQYNPATVSGITDFSSIVSASSGSYSGASPAVGENPVTEQTQPPSDDEIRIVAEASKEYYKKHSSGAGLCREGSMTLYDENKNAVGTYYFINGPWGNGAIEYGRYTVSGGVQSSETGMYVKDADTGAVSGWKFNVDVVPGRSGIRIHPDGNTKGTQGCFGIVGTVATLDDFYTKLKKIISDSTDKKVGLEYKSK